ncbi:MAG: MerR family transcriptional regulator [Akkermansiaceae bacterium]|nr:MerR family transcriptional regulator [Armatimonadota bacterium]
MTLCFRSVFARLGQVSVRTLRFYDERGLIKPARTDAQIGYRYYRADQIGRLLQILALRDLGFSLDEIGTALRETLPRDAFVALLQQKRTGRWWNGQGATAMRSSVLAANSITCTNAAGINRSLLRRCSTRWGGRWHSGRNAGGWLAPLPAFPVATEGVGVISRNVDILGRNKNHLPSPPDGNRVPRQLVVS